MTNDDPSGYGTFNMFVVIENFDSYLAISDNSISPSLFLSNDSSWNNDKNIFSEAFRNTQY